MSHSYNKIWIHAIYGTKDRQPLIDASIEQKVYEQKKIELNSIGCPVRIINGMPDHVHLLFQQNPKMAIIDILKQVKGGSSYWLNNQNLIEQKFGWQTGYAAYSVSESQLDVIHNYILNQKEHHKKRTFTQEYERFIELHGLVV